MAETQNEDHLQARNIAFPILSVLLLFGVLGNLLSLIVWHKGPRCKVLQCSLYFKILAISDIFVLIFRFTSFFVHEFVLDVDYVLKHCEIASIDLLLSELGPQISPWIIVTLSVERTLTILFPLKCSWKHSKRRTWLSFGCIVIILVILNCLWAFSIQNSKLTIWYCFNVWSKENTKILQALDIWVLGILPFIFIMVCNVLILIQMFRMRKVQAVTGRERRTEAFATFTILTIVTGLLHCVSVIPATLFNIADLENVSYMTYLYNEYRGYLFWNYFSYVMILLNNSLNFYVYCLAGRDFRKDLRHVLACFSIRNNSRVQIV